ncbi:hypothetical protein ACV1EC_16735 [Aeromonas hydrophila]
MLIAWKSAGGRNVNMIEINKSLFSKLYFEAYRDNSLRYHACIETEEEDKKFIKSVRSVFTLQSLELKVSIIVMQDDSQFLAIIGGHQFSSLPPDVKLQRLDESAGVVTVLGGEGALSPKDSYNFMALNWATVKSQENGEVKNLTRVSKDEVIEIFEEFSFYRIDSLPFPPINGGEDRFLLLLLLLLNIGEKEKLALKETFLDIIVNLEHFPFHLLHSAFISQTWQYSYIDIYRCIEVLYPIPRMIELRARMEARLGDDFKGRLLAINIFEDVNQATGWREIELNGLERLIKLCSKDKITSIFNVLVEARIVNEDDIEIINEISKTEIMRLGRMKPLLETFRDYLSGLENADLDKVSEYKSKRSAALIAGALYSARNKLVHFRLPSEAYERDNIKILFKVILCILNELYVKFQAEAYA